MLTVTVNKTNFKAACDDTPAFINYNAINLEDNAEIYHLCAFDEHELVSAAVLDPRAFNLTKKAIAEHLEIDENEFEISK